MKKDEAIRILRENNPKAPAGDLEMYAAIFLEYLQAAENIATNGTIVAHPRTAAPIENPYYRIRSAAMRELKSFERLRTDALWNAAKLPEVAPVEPPAPAEPAGPKKRRRRN